MLRVHDIFRIRVREINFREHVSMVQMWKAKVNLNNPVLNGTQDTMLNVCDYGIAVLR